MKEGEISSPFESTDNEGRDNGHYIDGKLCYKIIKVDKIIPAHTAAYENDFSQLQEQVKYSRQIKAIDKFLKEKIASTYIVIDPMFKDCEFNRGEWAKKITTE